MDNEELKIASEKYNLIFQTKLLVLYCKNRILGLDQYLKKDYFISDSLQFLFEDINLLKSKLLNPTAEILFKRAEDSGNFLNWTNKSLEIFLNFIDLLNTNVDFSDEKLILDNITSFIYSRELASLLNKKSDDIYSGNYDSLISELQETKPNILPDKNSYGFDLTVELFNDDAEKIDTGEMFVDDLLGGLRRKELTLLMAFTNVGKSVFTIWLSSLLIKKGYRVLLINLEMSLSEVYKRLFLTLLNDDVEFSYADFVPTNLEYKLSLYKEIKDKYDSYIKIAESDDNDFSVSSLNTLLQNNLFKPDVVMVDHLDLLKSRLPIGTDPAFIRYSYKDTVETLRYYAKKYNVSIFSPVQVNRMGGGKKTIIDLTMVSEDLNRVRTADTIWSLSENPEQILQSIKRIASIKSRRSSNRNTVLVKFDPLKLRFTFSSTMVSSQEIVSDDD